MSDTIGEIAVKLLENKMKFRETSVENSANTIFIFGQKNSGKSTIVNLFLEKDEKLRETFGLEYTFGRKTAMGQFGEKQICHIWELGGNVLSSTVPGLDDLVKIPLESNGGWSRCTAVIVVDLSQPHGLWPTLERSVSSLTSTTSLYILGGKFDLFKELDFNYKKSIVNMLRCAALLTGGGVMMFSNKDHTTRRKIKELFDHIGFGGPPPTMQPFTSGSEVDRPLQLMPGRKGDSWAAIGISGEGGWTAVGARVAPPSASLILPVLQDPSLDPSFREPALDALRERLDRRLQLQLGDRIQ